MAKDLAESQDSSICLIESNESEEYCATSDLLLSSQGDSFPLHSLNDGIGSESPHSSLHLQESELEEQLFGPTPPPSDNGADVGGGCGEADPPPFDIDSVSVVDVVVAGDEPKYGDDDPSVVDVAPLGLGPRRPADLVILFNQSGIQLQKLSADEEPFARCRAAAKKIFASRGLQLRSICAEEKALTKHVQAFKFKP
jgi:hypothetical protein